ncbi:MAG: GNAT family N-acetyltransferase [Bacteroidota bacterium]
MKVIIRKGRKEDVPAVHKLVMELATFEKAPEQVTNTVEKMMEDGFGHSPVYGLIVAESENKIIGMAIYFIKYSTWRGKGLFLEDLIVTETQRKSGIGKKVFDAVLAEAKKMGAKTMHWQVLDWNTPAIEFYKKYNCTFEGEWIDCKLNENQIKGMAI